MTFQSQVSALLYLLSVLAPICLWGWRTVRRENFALRFSVCFLVILVGQALIIYGIGYVEQHSELIPYLIWFQSARFLFVYLLSGVLAKICFECDWWGAFFCANVGYCVQHIGARAGSAVESFLLPVDTHWAAVSLAYQLFAVLACFLFWAIFTRRIPKGSGLAPENHVQILIAAFVIGITIVYNSFGISYAMQCISTFEALGKDVSIGYGSLMFVYVSSTVIAFLTLALNLGMARNRSLSDEKNALEFMLAESKRQYESEKRNIEVINMKCHDLKHQIGAMKGKLYEEQIEELGEVLMVYDASIKTGNETLDLILSQKTLYCGSRGIRLTCLLNGRNYSFIPRHELYALFDNALDNAIEAVEPLPEERRIISVTEEVRGNFLSVCVENYFDGRVIMENGVPISEKPGEGHGYGVKSIRMIAERNGGGVSISCVDGKFSLSIYFLMP